MQKKKSQFVETVEDCIVGVFEAYLWIKLQIVKFVYAPIRRWVYRNKPIEFLIKKDYEKFKKRMMKGMR